MALNEDRLVSTLMKKLQQESAVGCFPEAHIKEIKNIVREWVLEEVMTNADPYAALRESVREKVSKRLKGQ